MTRTLAFIAALVLLGWWAVAASAQTNCGPHADVAQRLAAGYGEHRQAISLAADNTVMEVYASLETGTWTIVVTRTDGVACLVAAGRGYEPTPVTPLGEPL